MSAKLSAVLALAILLALPLASANVDARIAFDASDVQAGGTRYIVISADDAVTNITVQYLPGGGYDNASGSYAAFAHQYAKVGINTVHVQIRDETAGARHDYYYAINVSTAPPAGPRDPRFNECHAGVMCPGQSAHAPGTAISFHDWFLTPGQIWDWIVWAFFFLVATLLGWLIIVRTVS